MKLIVLYETHRPDQVKTVDTLLRQCPAGKEALLLAKVTKKFDAAPEQPAKRARVLQQMNKYVVGDRVLIPLQRGAGGPEETLWVPAEVMEVAEAGAPLPSGAKYRVVTDEHCEAPNQGVTRMVFDEMKNSIRPEVCFACSGRAGALGGHVMATYATVNPKPPDTSQGPREGQKWRFSVNDRVACRIDKTGDGTGMVEWRLGTVLQVGARESKARQGTLGAYKIDLDVDYKYDQIPGYNMMPAEMKLRLEEQQTGGLHRAVYAARDVHWLVRAEDQQPPEPVGTPSIAGLRYAVRAVRDSVGRIQPGKWERYDHVTGHSQPSDPPKEDFSSGAAAAAAASAFQPVGE